MWSPTKTVPWVIPLVASAAGASVLANGISTSENAAPPEPWIPVVVQRDGSPSATSKEARKVVTSEDRKTMKPSLPPEDAWVNELLEG